MSHRFDKYEKAFLRSLERKKLRRKDIKSPPGTFFQRILDSIRKLLLPVGKKKLRIIDVKVKEKEQTDMKKKKKTKKNIHENKKSKTLHILKNLFFIVGTLILLGLIVFGAWFTTLEIPDVSNFEERKISNSTKIYDRTGEIVLFDIHENIRRQVVDLEDINQYAKDAIVAIEDHNFYNHNGVVLRSTIRAVIQTLLSRAGLSNEGTAGGSTITQQVVKNTLLNSQQIISRKVKEWILAYKIENQLTKDQILEIYLNEAPYGGTVYGIQEASIMFFGKPASDLTLGESAYLAAIPNLPTFYSPYGPNKDLLDQRQRTVLQEMKRYGYISESEYREAIQEEVEFLSREENSVKALHFVQYVRSYLEEQYGVDLVENGGLKVITTLDYELQERAESIIKEHVQEVEEEYNASNAALVAIESETGQIITMVGSRDYFDEDIDGNFNVATALRQPGSSFKPVAYANLFEKGYLPETVLFDVQTQFNVRCESSDFTNEDGCYSPRNYDGEFLGPLSIRNALAQSRNIPAVKALYLGGLDDTMRLAREMGINSLNREPSFYGLGLVLGGGEVSLLELTAAYAVFANEGEKNSINAILSIEDSEGNLLEEYKQDDDRVISRNTARMISSILSDNQARTPLFGSQSFLNFGDQDIAGKTGTTNDNRDAWLIGYHPEVAVGVWTGNNNNTPMLRGSSISGKPWRLFMEEIIEKYDNESFNDYDLPDEYEDLPLIIQGEWRSGSQDSLLMDTRTNSLAYPSTPEEYLQKIVRFEPHNILHWIDKNNPREINTERDDPQYENWEFSVQQFIQEEFQDEIQESNNLFNLLSEEYEEGLPIEPPFTFNLSGIEDEESYETNEVLEVELSFDDISENDIERIDVFVNNLFYVSDESEPFSFELVLGDIGNLEEENILNIIAVGEEGDSVSQNQVFFVQNIEGLEFSDVSQEEIIEFDNISN